MIDHEQLAERRRILVQSKTQLLADLNATEGAIQEVEHWLIVLDGLDEGESSSDSPESFGDTDE